jgi:hypothetical protein
MSQTIDTGLNGKRAKGAAMEAHAGTITIGAGQTVEPRRKRVAEVVADFRQRRIARAERAHSIRANAAQIRSVPGSEHAHLLRRPRGF